MRSHNQGDLKEAEKNYRAILSLDPKHIDALHYLGLIAFQVGQNSAAIELINKSLATHYNNAPALGNLGNVYQEVNNYEKAIEVYNASLSLNPDNFQIRANLGNACKKLKRFKEAQHYYLQVLEKAPDLIEVQRNLAEVYAEMGALPKSVEIILKAVKQTPDSFQVRTSCGNILKQTGNLKEAIKHFAAVVKILPEELNAKTNLGNCLAAFGDFEQAIELSIEVSEKSINSAEAQYNVAFIYYEAGYFDLAIRYLKKSLILAPDLVNARVLFSKFDEQEGTKGNIKIMEQMLGKSDIDSDTKAILAYALGSHYEKQTQFDVAFIHIKLANDLIRKQCNYDIEQDIEAFSNIIKLFNRSFVEKHDYFCDTQARPVFIVGMPRSGSTLVEQILSSHSGFFGMGEVPILANCIHQVFGLKNGIDCTAGMLSVNKEQLAKVAHDYLHQTQSFNSNATLLGDKLLMNFFHIGIIKMIFPDALIIHTKRDPVATCWSIYKSDFSRMGHYYAQTFEELSHFYQLYQNLMTHWHSIFPGEIYDISYEDLVSDQENETKKLVKACDLKWEPECLEFHTNTRRVATLSASQVRKPLYKSALDSWRHFEDNIQELVDLLK
ncbi:MAG: tetratricopeptide (TPR) repeat protein [Flavobacteriales bacterium]|jgi:tetratricopeptide (TPR) repeat protein